MLAKAKAKDKGYARVQKLRGWFSSISISISISNSISIGRSNARGKRQVLTNLQT